MKGGGAVYSVTRPGMVSGFQSEHGYREWQGQHVPNTAATMVGLLAKRRHDMAGSESMKHEQSRPESHRLDQSVSRKGTQPNASASPRQKTETHTQVRVLKDLRSLIESVP